MGCNSSKKASEPQAVPEYDYGTANTLLGPGAGKTSEDTQQEASSQQAKQSGEDAPPPTPDQQASEEVMRPTTDISGDRDSEFTFQPAVNKEEVSGLSGTLDEPVVETKADLLQLEREQTDGNGMLGTIPSFENQVGLKGMEHIEVAEPVDAEPSPLSAPVQEAAPCGIQCLVGCLK